MTKLCWRDEVDSNGKEKSGMMISASIIIPLFFATATIFPLS